MQKSQSSGIGFLSALGLLFIGLKLIGTIEWSWWWVLAPFWVMPTLAIVCLIIWVLCCIFDKDKTSWL